MKSRKIKIRQRNVYSKLETKAIENRLTDIDNKLMVTRGQRKGGRGKVRVWDQEK